MNNFAFAFHPSFFRRLWFKYIETKPYFNGRYWGDVRNPFEKIQQSKPVTWETWFLPRILEREFDEEEIEKINKASLI